MRGISSKAKVSKKLTKKTQVSLDWDNRTANHGTVKRIVAATYQEIEQTKEDYKYNKPKINDMIVFNSGEIGINGENENIKCPDCFSGTVELDLSSINNGAMASFKTESYRCSKCGGTGYIENPYYISFPD